MGLTRDSMVLWLGVALGIVTWLASKGEPPTVWTYTDWLEAVGFALSTISAKFLHSGLPSGRGGN